jgi:hypothetical protein
MRGGARSSPRQDGPEPIEILFVGRLDDVPDARRNRGVLEFLAPGDRGSSLMRSQRDQSAKSSGRANASKTASG